MYVLLPMLNYVHYVTKLQGVCAVFTIVQLKYNFMLMSGVLKV